MHGEHPTRRISLLIHASPQGKWGWALREGVEWASMSWYQPQDMWADFGHTNDKTQTEEVGTINICV